MTDKELVSRLVIEFFKTKDKEINDFELDLFETQIIDSMEVLELIVFLEQELGVQVDQELMVVDNFRTVNRIIGTVVGCE